MLVIFLFELPSFVYNQIKTLNLIKKWCKNKGKEFEGEFYCLGEILLGEKLLSEYVSWNKWTWSCSSFPAPVLAFETALKTTKLN